MLVQSWMKPETTKPVVAFSPFSALFWHLIGSPYFHRPADKFVFFWIYLSDEKISKLFNWILREAEGWGTNVWLHEKDQWYLSRWGCKDSEENVRLQENVLNSERDCDWWIKYARDFFTQSPKRSIAVEVKMYEDRFSVVTKLNLHSVTCLEKVTFPVISNHVKTG